MKNKLTFTEVRNEDFALVVELDLVAQRPYFGGLTPSKRNTIEVRLYVEDLNDGFAGFFYLSTAYFVGNTTADEVSTFILENIIRRLPDVKDTLVEVRSMKDKEVLSYTDVVMLLVTELASSLGEITYNLLQFIEKYED